jgi:prepilin-type N-terminal cleavage/methylation domain-containing protein
MKKLKKNNAFTLIEILVVATIITLLAAAGIVSYSQFLKQSRDAKRKADLEQIRATLEMYRSNNNVYISSSQNDRCSDILTYLISPEKYLEKIPADPKNTFYYRCNISPTDFTLGAYLESQTAGTTCGLCGTSTNCNYCLGPYGQK